MEIQPGPVKRCLSCGGGSMQPVLDLGLQPLANNFIAAEHEGLNEPRFPLEIQVCQDCWLLQISHIVPPVDLFSEYLYFSSFSDAMLRHAEEACNGFIDRLGLGADSFVAEIASNDGYLLRNFVREKIPCLGIEPAENIARVSREKGIDTVCEFFGRDTAEKLVIERGQADLILGNNVFAHAPDTNDFVAGLSVFLKQGGTIALEFPYGKTMVDKNEFDTIYHEHVFYFALTPLIPLFKRHGLVVYDVDTLSIHGGSLRIWVGHDGEHQPTARVAKMLEEEADAGLLGVDYYVALGDRARKVREGLLDLLLELKSEGKSIAAYGASAKGNTLLNYCQPPEGTIDFIADRSHFKQGKLSPGLHLPVEPAESLLQKMPDFALLLAWNFANEIIGQQDEYVKGGGRFIVPVPEAHIVSGE